MPTIEPIRGLSYGYGRGEAPVVTRPTGKEVVAAATMYNPVVASAQYIARPAFEDDEDFSASSYGAENDLWNDHYMSLGQTRSKDEFEATASRIREEQLNRSVLQSAGVGGLVAEIVSGTLSPTMAIPLVGQYRGIKGVMQTLSYAGAAASADELALLATRETYSAEEAAFGVAAGTVLGGMLGGAAKYLSKAERVKVERDLTAGSDMGALQDKGAIQYYAGKGSTSGGDIKITVDDLGADADMFRGELQNRFKNLEGAKITDEMFAEIMQPQGAKEIYSALGIEDIDSLRKFVDENKTTIYGPRTEEQSLSAAGRGPAQYLDAPNAVSRVLNKALARLNPVTRGITQSFSPVARRFTFQASDAGLRGTGNTSFLPHASEGTIEARVREYDAFTGQFILELDDAFSRHVRGDVKPADQLQGGTIAHIQSAVNRPVGSMSKEEFNDRAFMLAQTGEAIDDPNLAKAVSAWHKLTAQFEEYAEEAYKFRQMEGDTVGRLFDPEGNLGSDAVNYVNHAFSDLKIGKDPAGFVQMLEDNAAKNLNNGFKKSHEKLVSRRAKLEKRLEILQLTPEASRARFAQVNDDIADALDVPAVRQYNETRLVTEREIRKIKAENSPEVADPLVKELRDDLKFARESSPELKEALRNVNDLRAERTALNQSAGRYEDIKEDLLNRAVELEELDLNNLERVLNAGGKLSRELDKVSDATQAGNLKKLWTQVTKALKSVETQDKRIASLYGKKKDLTPTEAFQAYEKSMIFSKRRAKADAKTEELLSRIEGVEALDLPAQRDLLRAVQDLNNVKTRDILARRAVREDKLTTKAEDFTPERLAERARETQNDIFRLEDSFEERWRARGATDLNVARGEASFSEIARETAEELAERIQGMQNPIAGLEILGGKRGPELARVLNIPLEIKSKYLETDLEKLSRIYARKMGPDIELYRATGSVNGAPVFRGMREDFRNLRTRITESDIRPKSKSDYNDWIEGRPVDLREVDTIPFPDADKGTAVEQLNKAQIAVEEDLRTIVTRLRNQRGVPENPDGIMFRMGRAAKDLNVARYMGSVVLSSIPDVGRPVMKYGFAKTMKQGWGQYSRGMAAIKMTRQEARRMGVAWDPIMHNRVQQVMDVMDDYGQRKTKVERGIGFAANKTGLVAGFDQWTAEMKQITSGVVLSELGVGLRMVAEGVPNPKEGWYKTFLAEHGLDERMSKRIWGQYMKEGGSDEFADGFRLPNTEGWDDISAKRAFRAAVNRAVDATIVTPGVDLPSWTDKNLAFSMLAQFQSFTFASTNRVLLSGAQQADMALLNGVGFSLALGMVSYYLWATSIGGDHLTEAQKFDSDKWLDEGISRSGLLGVFGIPYELSQKIPATQNLATFSNQPVTRRRTSGLLGTALGPSYDLAEKAAAVITGLDDPTQSTLHQARLMGPWQNVFYLRTAIDAVEEQLGSTLQLPERR